MTYSLTTQDQAVGTSKQDEFPIPPCLLAQRFGSPSHESEESIGSYTFKDPDGEVFTVYMIAYDVPKEAVPQGREEFWQLPTPVPMSVGAINSSGVQSFKAWLSEQLTGNGC